MELSIRVTTPDLSHNDIKEIIDPVSDKYIISLEHAKSRHFQCYINYIDKDDSKQSKLRYRFKKQGLTGNKLLSITQQKSDNLKVYVLKEGDYIYKGFTDDQIKNLQAQSYEKKLPYKTAKRLLLDNYNMDIKITTTKLLGQLLGLQIKHRIPYNKERIIQTARSAEMLRDTNEVEKEFRDIIKIYNKRYK